MRSILVFINMTDQHLKYKDKLKQNFIKIIFLVITLYVTIVVFLYQYYNKKAKIEKIQMLDNHYGKLIEVSLNKISTLTHQLSTNIQDQNTFNSSISDLEICNRPLA